MTVLAAVITYNPDDSLGEHLRALRRQCPRVVVVDNGSRNVDAVARAAAEAGCELVRNGSNVGVAAALNQAVEVALAEGATWLATFDQDSLLPEGAIAGLLAAHAAHPERDRIGIVTVAHRDRATHADYHHPFDIAQEGPDWRLLRTTITSGSMVRCDVLRQMGGFESRLFIDSVDHEFCLRLRRRGWHILEARHHVMDHSIGAATIHRLLWRDVVCTHHSPARRYYMVRNGVEVCLRYVWFDPEWALKAGTLLLAGAAAVVLFESQKLAKTGAMLRGLRDVALRRFGPIR